MSDQNAAPQPEGHGAEPEQPTSEVANAVRLAASMLFLLHLNNKGTKKDQYQKPAPESRLF